MTRNSNSENENEDLRSRMTKAENKIMDLEELVQTLASENLQLRISIAEIKSLLGLQNPNQEAEQSRSSHSEVRKSVEKEEENRRQSLQSSNISHEESKSNSTASLLHQRSSEEGSPRPNPLSSEKKAPKESGLFQPERLFENVLVISVADKDIPDCLNDSQSLAEGDSFISEASLSFQKNFKTRVLWNFAEIAQMEPNITVPDIEKFATPCDFRVTDLGEDTGAIEKIFHKTVLKYQRKYTRKYICPFHPHDNGIVRKWHKEVNTFNPHRKLYAACIKKSDFVVINDGKNKKVFTVDTIYCMLTYYPIPNLIFDLLTSILNLVKRTRSQIYWNSGGKDIELADYKTLQDILLNQVKDYVKTLSNIPQPVPCDTIEYLFKNDISKQEEVHKYSYSLNSQAYLELASWQASRVFSKFGLENIKFLVSALLLEKCVVFISHDIVTTTSVLNTLLGLLYPFKYFHVIVPNAHPQLVNLCGAPMPITICINQKEDYFWETRLYRHSRDIFVFLDSQIIYQDETDPDFSKIPVLDCLSAGIEELYKEFNPRNSFFDFITDFNELKRVHPIKLGQYVNEKEIAPIDREKCQKLFKHFRTQLERNVAVNMTYFKGYSPAQSQNINLEKQIEKFIKNQNNKDFFNSFITTQGFLSFRDYEQY